MDISKLKELGACLEAVNWTGSQIDDASAWNACERGDWMLWLLGRISGPAWSDTRKPLTLAACECARLALPYTKDPRILACIETAEAWTRGEATPEQVRAAAAADAAAAYDAAAAADAAAVAAAYAAADAAAAAKRKEVLRSCADIVRKYYPVAPKL